MRTWRLLAVIGLLLLAVLAWWCMTAKSRAARADYVVIDLSKGPSVSTFPVRYLSSIPRAGWTDEYKTTKLVMRRIPDGTFTMGSPNNEPGRVGGEIQHQVTLSKGFYIGVFEVTQRQWERVMGNWPSRFTNVTARDTRPVENVTYYEIRENPLPVASHWEKGSAISSNWPQSSGVYVESFMGKLRKKTGLATLDLPTEAQWEYACRAGTTTGLNSGKELTNPNLTGPNTNPNLSELGRYRDNHPGGYSDDFGVSTDGGTAKVGSYLPNAWGLYDMHANVREWCLDWHGKYPENGHDPLGPASGSRRVVRGGCWYSFSMRCRSAWRDDVLPAHQSPNFGLRLVVALP